MADEITKHDVAYLTDIDDGAKMPSSETYTKDHVLVVGEGRNLLDSGKTIEELVDSEKIGGIIEGATADLRDAVSGVYAIDAYSAAQWEDGRDYAEGDLCQRDGTGYRCVEEHSASGFDADKWQVVLTPDGREAITAMLAKCSTDGLAKLTDVAPRYNGNARYEVGQLVVKDDALCVCTAAGRGPAATLSTANATVESALASRLKALAEDIAAKYATGGDIVAEYDTSGHGYAEGDACSRGGKVYKCTSAVEAGAEWDEGCWTAVPYDEIIRDFIASDDDPGILKIGDIASEFAVGKSYAAGDVCSHEGRFYVCKTGLDKAQAWNDDDWVERTGAVVAQADWGEADATSPSFIRNKPDLDNLDGYAELKDIVAEYDTSEHGYEIGDVCSHNGRFYVCVRTVTQGYAWVDECWEPKTFAELSKADWNAEEGQPGYIENKPTIPKQVNADWNAEKGEPGYIENKPTIPGGVDISGLVAASSIVNKYDETRDYTKGDLCSHDGKIWRLDYETAGAEPWTKAHWTPVTYDTEVDRKLESLEQANADWDEKDENSAAYIRNKPDLSAYFKAGDLWPEYSESYSYGEGEYVSHGGKFYRSVRAMTAGTWEANASNWTPVEYEDLVRGLVDAKEVNADWNAEEGQPGYIENKPTIPEQANADWDEKDEDSAAYILNKPTITYSDGILAISKNASQDMGGSRTDFYTKSETNTLLGEKADKSDVSTLWSALSRKVNASDILELKYTINGLQDGVKENATGVAGLGDRVTELETGQKDLNDTIAGQENDIADLNEKVAAINSDDGLSGELNALSGRIDALESGSELEGRVGSLETASEQYGKDLNGDSESPENVKGLKNRVKSLESDVTSLSSSVSEIKECLDDFNTELAALI